MEDIKKRIEELEKQKDDIYIELRKYKDMLYENEEQKEFDKNKQYENKYYKVKENSLNHKDIIAFKIVKVLKPPNQYGAQCLVLENFRNGEKAIKTQTVSAFFDAMPRLMPQPNAIKVIDLYNEITKEEFLKMFNEYKKEMEELL